MGKFLRTVLVGAASGAAAAYFLSTEKGQEIKQKVSQAVKAYKENPDAYHQQAAQKVTAYKEATVNSLKDYKEKFETGQLTDEVVSSVKEKASQAGDFANHKFSQVKDHVNQTAENSKANVEDLLNKTEAQVDDIVIDYSTDEKTDSEDA